MSQVLQAGVCVFYAMSVSVMTGSDLKKKKVLLRLWQNKSVKP